MHSSSSNSNGNGSTLTNIVIGNKSMKVLLDEATLEERIAEINTQITRDYAGKELVLVVVLKGSIMFAADLCRHIQLPLSMEFMGLSSYGDSTESSGVVRVTLDLSKPVVGKEVLIIEDIVDTGLTMRYLLENMSTRKPSNVRVCTLLHKPSRSKVDVILDYVGFTIDDHFVVGYGLDYEQKYRNLSFIGYMTDEA
ncbi:MAG TPA: hypoxanthine phosphoribosyltransferase [Myxococcales bacterium]|nr:hypoxanthine phosphoribosyltransferase [Myxococcales bacterium]